ncbi:glutamyl-tRNA(Gln) amidotransferase subunit C, mitochondrial [Phymastichus coffea]|uniref:glutamyl-tRNA(Gln) amidotransferase subunit C, mitochondrial n=1 Tax=Phymastichus coffea TaxID=108790 RepID=UPI00273C87BE|nr:glutamyl-tRNA(Gln) amidotransferase subunit C, mitochondrial [Phymastichus coffea]
MGLLARCGFKYNSSFYFANQIKRSTSLAHSKGSVITVNSKTENNFSDVKIDKNTIIKLERISLVDFANEGGIERLEAAIQFAQKLKEVTLDSSVSPMYSVLENEKLELREDKIAEENCRREILKNAKVLEDEYFVAPPGNIPKS